MADVRFPYVAYYRRLNEAHKLSNAALGRWLYDRTRAKRLAARTVLRHRLGDGADLDGRGWRE